MFADVLNTPISKLSPCQDINLNEYFVNGRSLNSCELYHVLVWMPEEGKSGVSREMANLLVLDAILKNILYYETACLAQGNLMPHAFQSLIYFEHDLRGLITPAKLEQFLPNMACIAMDHRFGDSSKKFMHHHGLVFFGDTVKGFLDDMASKRVHAEAQSIASYRIRDGNYLFRRTMFKASLHEKIPESVHH